MPKGIPGRAICAVDGCNDFVKGYGLCSLHLGRWQQHGDVAWTRRAEAERVFWSRVDKTPDCWLLTGYVGPRGYGHFGHGNHGAHRFALEQGLGRPLAPGMFACHSCDNPSCVRNDDVGWYEINGVLRPRAGHLWEGTTQENTADRHAKGRSAAGEKNGDYTHPERLARGESQWLARFTEDEIRAIRRRVAAGERQKDIAREYGAGTSTIFHIVHRESWKHVA